MPPFSIVLGLFYSFFQPLHIGILELLPCYIIKEPINSSQRNSSGCKPAGSNTDFKHGFRLFQLQPQYHAISAVKPDFCSAISYMMLRYSIHNYYLSHKNPFRPSSKPRLYLWYG